MSYQAIIQCFRDLKEQGVTQDEILDVLEFDSDEYPDHEMLTAAKKEVFG